MTEPTHSDEDDANDYRAFVIKLLEQVQLTVADLPEDSIVTRALPATALDAWIDEVSGAQAPQLLRWPPTILHAVRISPEQLGQFDADVTAIAKRLGPTAKATGFRWLVDPAATLTAWRGGFFETVMRARALAFSLSTADSSVEFEAALPNGRNVDIRLTSGARTFFLECTVINESREDLDAEALWLEARKTNPSLPLVRPGPFDDPSSKGPSPYYDANRMYEKVFDKLQKDGDPARSQTSDEMPNVLLLSFAPGSGPLSATSPAVGWVLDELFADHADLGAARIMPVGGEFNDVSLAAFLRRDFPVNATDLLPQPRRLSAILNFGGARTAGARLNEHAEPWARITPNEMTTIENIFCPSRGWEET